MAVFGSFVAGQVLTAAELNAAGTWQDYTPSWTQSATITKTVNFARYCQFNKLVFGSVKMTATSAGTANNKILVGLPIAASSNNFIIGTMNYFDNSGGSGYMNAFAFSTFYETSTTAAFSPCVPSQSPSLGYGSDLRFGQNVGVSNGLTVASSDVIWIQFMYEAS